MKTGKINVSIKNIINNCHCSCSGSVIACSGINVEIQKGYQGHEGRSGKNAEIIG